jgi:GntR family transcriptional regulator, rspAB operon transcriptional repressor
VRPKDLVYASLKRRILLNDLKPAAALTELGVAQDMGCSQGTVREVLMRLQEDGLVLREGHRGTSVTPLDATVAGEMLALRRSIETRGAPWAAAAMTADARSGLVRILRAMELAAAQNNEYELIECDTTFHMTLFGLSGFKALEPILLRLILHSHRQKLWEPRHRRPLRETARRHVDILAALDQGGQPLARELGRHIDTIVDIDGEIADSARQTSGAVQSQERGGVDRTAKPQGGPPHATP